MISFSPNRQRLFAPEVIQTSEMDCGPATLKSLLEGHGIPVSYGRLREACQTDVDGTSIDALEEIAGPLGLEAEQVMIPLDHLLLPESQALPAIVVVRTANGATHFVVVWRRHGSMLQVMDPDIGRRWISCRRFLEDVYLHRLAVPAQDWYEWACSDEFRRPLYRRLNQVGIRNAEQILNTTKAASKADKLAKFDAAVRLVQSLVDSGGIQSGRESRRFLASLLEDSKSDRLIPDSFWSAKPERVNSNEATADVQPMLQLRGAVLIRVTGVKSTSERLQSIDSLPRELTAAMTERQSSPLRYLLSKSREAGIGFLVLLVLGVLAAAAGVVVEAILFRGIMDLAEELRLTTQRFQAASYYFLFAIAMLTVEWGIVGRFLRLGRLMEIGLRIDFLRKIPRLSDRYFQSRPLSDMAQRSHHIHNLRTLPSLAVQLLQTASTLVFTTVGLCWLFPNGRPIAILAAILSIIIPCLFRRTLQERDLRMRTHAGALSRFYLDALEGLVPIRSHSAQRVVRREHKSLLVEWARANLRFVGSQVSLESFVAIVGYGLSAYLVYLHFRVGANAAGALLLAYWSMQLPVLGQQFAKLFSEMPFHRSLVLRAIEPLGAPEEDIPTTPNTSTTDADAKPAGVEIAFDSVSVRAGGHVILEDVNLQFKAGEHVAIVGPSGSGKSSLVGLLQGWHRPSAGAVSIDQVPFRAESLERLRNETAWVDPAVQIWNRSLIDNLRYGNENENLPLDEILQHSELHDLLTRLEDGLQTRLGGSGGLLSGGEGQRIRFGRALSRRNARLVILDEPFRGLDRETRRKLLRRARQWWKHATLLCITHDVADTLEFPRVIVIDQARVVEDASPEALQKFDSRFRQLLDAEQQTRDELWSRNSWRRLRLQDARLIEERHSQTDFSQHATSFGTT